MQNVRGFLIPSFRGGLSDWEDKGIAGAFKFGSGLDVRRRKDSLKANQGLTDDLATGGVLDGRAHFIVPASDGNTYIGCDNGDILKRTSSGVYSLVHNDSNGAILGMAESYNNAGDTFITWANATKLHRKRILTGTTPVNTDWSDVDATVNGQTYPKSNLTSDTWHIMKWSNGTLYICNKDKIALVGYDDSYTSNALDLIPGNVSRVLFDDGIYTKIASNRVDSREEGWIYAWDGIAQSPNDRRPLPFSEINAVIKTEMPILQYGSEGYLYFFGDETGLPITKFPGGGSVKPDGVTADKNLALFGVYGATTGKNGIYSYGRRWKNSDFILNLEYPLEVDEITAIKKVGSDLLIAYKSGSSYGVKKVDSSNKLTRAVYQSLDLKLPSIIGKDYVTSNVYLDMEPLPAGCSVEVWRRMNKVETGGTYYDSTSTGNNDGWCQCETVDSGAGSYTQTDGTEAVFSLGDLGRILELQVVLNCSGNSSPEVYRIRAPFD